MLVFGFLYVNEFNIFLFDVSLLFYVHQYFLNFNEEAKNDNRDVKSCYKGNQREHYVSVELFDLSMDEWYEVRKDYKVVTENNDEELIH